MRKIGGCSGIAAIAVYLLGTILSIMQLPSHFNPFDIFISNLGNYGYNPPGAIIYNAGAIIGGILLVPFFISIGSWHDLAKTRKFFYIGAELFGIALALGMAMQAIYSQDTPLHRPWSTVCFLSMATMLLLANVALFRNPRFRRSIGYYGFAAVLANLAFMLLYAMGSCPVILEWVAVYAGLLWVLLMSLNALNTQRTPHHNFE